MNVTVLLSGGIDSAACAVLYIELGYKVSALHVDYGQLARLNEQRAAKAVADYLRVPFEAVSINTKLKRMDGEIVGRNAFLLSLALQEVGTDSQLLAIGIHSGTHYCDCSPEFIEMMNDLTMFQTDGSVQVGAPFLSWSKRQIWDFARQHDFPMHLTYSCERGGDTPCGICASCKDVRLLHAC